MHHAPGSSAPRTSAIVEVPSQPSGDHINPLAQILRRLDELAVIQADLRVIREMLAGHRKPLLTVDEVAELTGRAPFTIRRWIAEGRLTATRVEGTGPKGRLLIAQTELDRLIVAGLGQKVPATAAAA